MTIDSLTWSKKLNGFIWRPQAFVFIYKTPIEDMAEWQAEPRQVKIVKYQICSTKSVHNKNLISL